jgi:hypothetical protein
MFQLVPCETVPSEDAREDGTEESCKTMPTKSEANNDAGFDRNTTQAYYFGT